MANPTCYKPGASLLHRTDPRIKMVVLVLFTILIFILQSFSAIGILFVTIAILWKLAGIGYRTIISYMKLLMILFILLMIMQTIFYPGEIILLEPLIPEWFPLLGGKGNITLEGILYGMILCLRVLTLMCTLPLLLVTTTIEELSLAMVKMGLSYKVAFTATTALNQLPILRSDIVAIMNAQKLRGFTVFDTGKWHQKLKAFPTLVVPLVMGAMRRATLMGVAMDSRAFGSDKKRSYIMSIKTRPADWVFLIISTLFGAGLLAINVYWI
jgi:energy-coupling factor transport system permease protein